MAKIKAARNGSKKDVITQKAAALFRKKGFAGSSMRELAETIGVEAPSLYNHIGSKSEILQTICFKIASEFNEHLAEIEETTTPVLDKLEKLIRFHINIMLNEYDEVYVANHEWKQLQEPFLGNFLIQRKAYESRMVKMIEQGVKNKELKTIHPYVAVLTILSALRGLESWHRHRKNIQISKLENDMVLHLLTGLTK
ncbi:MAG: TetR family transcriptional regulator [Ferruginibacter sp.]